jgi:prolyl-tRNA synthetase
LAHTPETVAQLTRCRPLKIAPYAVLIVQMKVGDEAQDTLCQKLHDDLTAAGIDVLWDERKKVRPGAKFKDLGGHPKSGQLRSLQKRPVEKGSSRGPTLKGRKPVAPH